MKQKSIFKRILAAGILFSSVVAILSQALPALAEAGWNIILTPNKKEYFAHPGDTIVGEIRVRNDGDVALENIVAFAKNFTANEEETGDPRILDETDEMYQYELASWLEFKQDPITIPAEDSVLIEYTINVPDNAEPGGHYAILYLQQVNPGEGQTAVGILSKMGSLLLVTVSGAVDVEGDILEFYTGKKLYEYLPVDFYLRMENVGNVHYRPAGSIFVNDWNGRQVGVIQLNESRGVVLPESVRRYQSFWSEAFLVEEYVRDEDGNVVRDENGEKIRELKVNWQRLNLFRIGKYTATAIVVFDDENNQEVQLTATTSFWVIPWKLILIIIVSILVLVYLIRKLNRWYNKRLIEKYEDKRREEEQRLQKERAQKRKQKLKRQEREKRLERIRQRVRGWFSGRKAQNGSETKEKNSLKWED